MKYTRILCSLHSLHDGQLVEDSLHNFISLTNKQKKNTHTHLDSEVCIATLGLCSWTWCCIEDSIWLSPRSQYVTSNLIFRLLLKKQDSRRNFLHKHFDFFHYNIFAPFRTFKQTCSEHYTGNNIPKAAYDCSTAGLFNKVKMWAVRAYGTASTFN